MFKKINHKDTAPVGGQAKEASTIKIKQSNSEGIEYD
jgi:hypothetical protein